MQLTKISRNAELNFILIDKIIFKKKYKTLQQNHHPHANEEHLPLENVPLINTLTFNMGLD